MEKFKFESRQSGIVYALVSEFVQHDLKGELPKHPFEVQQLLEEFKVLTRNYHLF